VEIFICILSFVIGCILSQVSAPALTNGRRCVYLRNSKHMNKGQINGTVEYCARTQCCAGFYRLIDNQPVAEILGCDVVERDCPNSTCSASRNFHNYTTCACSSDFCNGNVTWNPERENSKPQRPSSSLGMDHSFCLVKNWLNLTFISTHLLEFKRCPEESLPEECQTSLCSCNQSYCSEIDFNNIELQQIVGQGHYSLVWHGKYRETVVAVKVFPEGSIREFTSEREVYGLPHLAHSGITHFLGAGRKLDSREWVIILELAPWGSLSSFLTKNTSDWTSTLKLAESLSGALAFLHSDFIRHGLHKPAVAHRDLSSSNVLMKVDGTCALCDFGCSTILRSCSSPQSWQRHADNLKGNIQRGTLCYMAPEFLDGCVNLSSGGCLIQGDVYALGLLLWELCMRCSDLFKGCPVPEHKLPYEEELGTNPCLQQLISHVFEKRERPSIPKHLQQGSVLHDILLDCWDHDSEARLTAQCAKDRLATLRLCHSV
uniref:receptor protein serine/threonine kinase n=1 Tax=Esox lucius TaxID=8010 RepID=A0A6Q2Y6E2_ESOLU